MGSCAAPSAKGDDKFITTDYLQQCPATSQGKSWLKSSRLSVKWHCCKVSDEAAFCLIQRPYISKTLLTRRISPRGSP
ncbi:hypothetical protein F2P37_20425 [Acinetobacter baumannii]|nr:hypothetical protein [Acinetobacter baumannii]MQQ89476.1 hypothetical protein [Acinetobacter baumannii]MQR70032.1 hypothetical protein [Acinetobacter baumannii]MQR93612.1 hypothetical protein [Acinetobacter baumannii]